MSEIKFACPHCSQHIACEDMYCGERISCPGCEKELLVPQRSAFIPLQSGNITMALPVAFKERPQTRAVGLDLWSEKEWDDRASQMGVVKSASLLPLWILLFLPFVVALISVMHHTRLAAIGTWFILCALAGGFYLAKSQKKSGGWLVVMGFLYSIAALVFYVIVAFGLLFVGCLIAIH
jgi:hypothetical protein